MSFPPASAATDCNVAALVLQREAGFGRAALANYAQQPPTEIGHSFSCGPMTAKDKSVERNLL